ncbi:MAG: bifunctional pyr operon transcriptional regulator/uracil phosphoribosyltransferase PyrR [Myxococcales bacterium]|nr:bifunctional pyr operon transcriptional regulator/uracil phosphoribosyltransferase PyrR [Myxococcales bacterium]
MTAAPEIVLDGPAIAATLDQMALAIATKFKPSTPVALVGIRRGGVPLAEALGARLSAQHRRNVLRGAVDITLYRDDAATALPNPLIGRSDIAFELAERVIVLVDDVLYTGRTVRAALDALLDYGRPKAVSLAVLIDRGHRELPIAADFIGLSLDTEADARVEVVMGPEGPERVELRRR